MSLGHEVLLPQLDLESIKTEDVNPLSVLSDTFAMLDQDTDDIAKDGENKTILVCIICLATARHECTLLPMPQWGAWLSIVAQKGCGVCVLCSSALRKASRLVQKAKRAQAMLVGFGDITTESLPKLINHHNPLVELKTHHNNTDVYNNTYVYNEEQIDIKIEELKHESFDNTSDFAYNTSDDEPIVKIKRSKTTIGTKPLKIENKKTRLKRKLKPSSYLEGDRLIEEFFETREIGIEEQRSVIARRRKRRIENFKYKCDDCFKGFSDEKEFEGHMADHTKNQAGLTCTICGELCTSSSGLTKHERSHARRKAYSCKRCTFKTSVKGSAKIHADMHAGKKYECNECGQTFGRQPSYLSHMRIKHPSGHACGLCGYSFLGEKGVRCHIVRAHRGEEVTIPEDAPKCEQCDLRFKTETALATHRRVSPKHGECCYNDPQRSRAVASGSLEAPSVRRPRGRLPGPATPRDLRRRDRTEAIDCEQCGAPQSCAFAYRHHFQRYHSGSARTVLPAGRSLCPVCGVSVKVLKQHMAVHTEADRRCAVCGKSFKTKGALKSHAKIHREPRFVCPTCGKRFNQRSNLNRHYTYVHTTIRDVKCDHCDKYYKSIDEKKAHVKFVHLKKPWPKKKRNRIDTRKRDGYDSDTNVGS